MLLIMLIIVIFAILFHFVSRNTKFTSDFSKITFFSLQEMENSISVFQFTFFSKIHFVEIYHYDNLTDCEAACEVPCGTTYVIRNDVDERRQYTCTQRKAPVISAFMDINNTGILTFVLAAALVRLLLLLLRIIEIKGFLNFCFVFSLIICIYPCLKQI